MHQKICFLILVLSPFHLFGIEFLKDYLDYSDERPFSKINNDFIYGDGSTEVTSEINEYDPIVVNQPIHGSIFVTHDAKNEVDVNSFRLGNKPLKVTLVKSTAMSSSSNLVVTIYSFQLEGISAGTHTLPPINVKVASELVQALPLVIQVSS